MAKHDSQVPHRVGNEPRGRGATALPGWLIMADDGAPLDRAAARLRRDGVAVVLAWPGACPPGLPPALPGERAEAPRLDPEGYLIRRRIARGIAAALTGCDAGAIAVGRLPGGAPRLTGPAPLPHLSFSTRGGFSLVGLATRPIGVDIELPILADAIPWNMLRAEERDHLAALDSEARAGAFVALWSRKEAVLKALNAGFSMAPEVVSVPLETTLENSDNHYRVAVSDVGCDVSLRECWLDRPKASCVTLALLSGDAG